MMEKLKKLLLYAGAEPEDFARCQMDVQIANRRRLTAFLGTACAFFVALTLGSCMVPLLYDHIPVFAVALIVGLGLLAVEQMLPQKLGLFLNWEIYAFGAMVYALGIYLGTVQTPDQRATAFFAFLLCVPMLFMMRPILAHCQCAAVRRHFSGLRHPLQGLAGHPHGCLQRVGVRGHLLHCVHLCHEYDVRQLYHQQQADDRGGKRPQHPAAQPQCLREPPAGLPAPVQQQPHLCLHRRQRPP